MELTDAERIVLAIFSEPIERSAIGGCAAPIASQQVAAIWSDTHDKAADTRSEHRTEPAS